MQNNNRGGSRETDVNEFAVNPRGAASLFLVVTIVTPVRKALKAARKAVVSAGFEMSIVGMCAAERSLATAGR